MARYWRAAHHARILNEICKQQFEKMGFPDGIDGNRVSGEWRGRLAETAKAKWELRDDLDVPDKIAMDRDRWEAIIRITAARVGLVPEPESEEVEGHVVDDEAEDEGGTFSEKQCKQDAADFRKRHTKADDDGSEPIDS